MLRWALLGLAGVIAATLLTGVLAFSSDRGYSRPSSRTMASGSTSSAGMSAPPSGLSAQFWTPPARVRIRHDGFALLNIRLANRQVTTVEAFPPSQFEGTASLRTTAHVRRRSRLSALADASHLEYFLAVTNSDAPLAKTFVCRPK